MPRIYSRSIPALVALSSICLIVLTGCGATSSFTGATAASKITGKVYGGQQPLADSLVTVWAVGTAGYGSPATFLASTATADDGTFAFADDAYTCPAPYGGQTQVYITAQGGSPTPGQNNPNIALAAGVGNCSSAKTASVEINEVTTAVTAFALAQFFTPTFGAPSQAPGSVYYAVDFGTNTADLPSLTLSNTATIPLLVDRTTGLVNPNTTGSSTAPAINIEAAKIYSIADTLAACVNETYDSTTSAYDNCVTLFGYTQQPGPETPVTPTDTLEAAVDMALYPSQNVQGLYSLAQVKSPFVGLTGETGPNDWTIGVSYTTSAFGLGITGTSSTATSASIDIDAAGNIWFPSNLTGSTGVAYFDPANTTFNGPYVTAASTQTANLVQPQYVAIDSNGLAWVADSGSASYGSTNTKSPGTGDAEYQLGGTSRFGPVAADYSGDVYLGYTVPGSNPYSAIAIETAGGIGPYATLDFTATGLVGTTDFVYASTSSTANGGGTACALEMASGDISQLITETDKSYGNCTSGGVALYPGGLGAIGLATSLNQTCSSQDAGYSCGNTADPDFVDLPEGIATDGAGAEWYVMSGNGTIFVDSMDADNTYMHNAGNGGTVTTPYAVAIDGSGNLWIANASCVTTSSTECTPTAFILSEIIGAAAPTITPLSSQMNGDGLYVGVEPGNTPILSEGGKHPVRSKKSASGGEGAFPFIGHRQ